MKDRKKQRLPGFNYSTDGAYFVTVCVQNMQYCFGNVENETMALNQTGKIVDHQWNWIFEQYAYVHRDEFVVMPNHVHGILWITDRPEGVTGDTHRTFGRPTRGSIDTIMRSYKGAVTPHHSRPGSSPTYQALAAPLLGSHRARRSRPREDPQLYSYQPDCLA